VGPRAVLGILTKIQTMCMQNAFINTFASAAYIPESMLIFIMST